MSSNSAFVQDEFFETLLADFLDEATQLTDRLNEDLLVLDEWASSLEEGDAARCDDDLMNNMFRSAHSIKGLSAMLGLPNINNLTHKIENIFDAARKDELSFNGDIVETIFKSVDSLVAMVEKLSEDGNDEIDADEVLTQIQDILQSSGCERQQSSQEEAENSLQGCEEVDENPDCSEPPAANAEETAEAINDEPPASAPEPEPEMIDHFADIQDETEVPAKYLSIFIDETVEAVDSLSECLLRVESQEDSGAEVESLLITSHRIKGSAASVGLNRPAKLSHLMEDIFQELRETGGALTSEVTDAMLKCTDALRIYVAGLKVGNPESSSFNELANGLLSAKANAAGEDENNPASIQAPRSKEPSPKSSPSSANGFSDELLSKIQEEAPEAIPSLVGRVHFEKDFPLVGLKGQLICEKLSSVGNLFYCDPSPEGLDELDDLKAITFALATDQPSDALQGKLEIVSVRKIELQLLAKTSLQAADSPEKQLEEKQAPASQSSATAAIQKTQQAKNLKAPNKPASASKTPAKTNEAKKRGGRENGSKPNETLRVDIERLDQLMNLAGQLVINKSRFNQIGERMKEALLSKQTPQTLTNAYRTSQTILEHLDVKDAKDSSSLDIESVRSHARRLQADLEIIHREINQLTNLRNGVTEFFESIHQLDRVADGIQQSVMDTRMVPIGPLFGRFKRVVRDITRSSGKDIQLVIRGENTELDKRMVDELGDPLIHMVRNSADHGIESPEVREAAGKPRQGTVTLDAFHRGNSIVIEITDDGKGLDRDKIISKAIGNDILTQADVEKMTDHQIYQLIWEPGFSTAEVVTEISGRGMGMDIVRSKISDINGIVEVDSVPGKGAVFTIKLPLTLAILPSLLSKIDGDVFAIPVESIVEIVTVPKSELSTVHGLATATIRGRVVSVIELDQIFDWSHGSSSKQTQESTDLTLVIMGQEGKEISLAADLLLGEEDIVIKSMAENYRNVPGIAGASILGDGSVSLILDVAALIEMSTHLA